MMQEQSLHITAESIPTLDAAAKLARAINAQNGWGLDFKFENVPTYLALIHSEVTEAWLEEEPEEVARELGDVIVRCLDLGELVQPGGWADYPHGGWRLSSEGKKVALLDAESFLEMHEGVSAVLEIYRKQPDQATAITALVNRLFVVADDAIWNMAALGAQHREVVASILQANAQRAYRHGNLRT